LYVQGVRAREIEQRLLGLAPSVFFVHTYTGTCISGAKTFTVPSITPCHRTFGWPCLIHYFPRGCGGRSPVTMWRQYTRQAVQLGVLRDYDVVLTHSSHIRDEMIGHGVSTDVIAYPVRRARAAGVADQRKWRLLFAGRMTLLKGGEYLLRALPRVAASLDRPVQVVFAGDGPERSSLEARAREIVATNPKLSIDFAGWVAESRLAGLLDETDLLVVPSLWPEPFGSVGPMAAGHGVPSAAFDLGGIREWLADGVGGHLAPGDPPMPEGLAAAIVCCLADPSHHAQLRKGARRASARFTMEQHLAELMPALRRATESSRRP
jgi:glycosyltransferase involved in cell wall biosynthesis